jgi:hypothetical protein
MLRAAAMLRARPMRLACSMGIVLALAPFRILSTNFASVLKCSVTRGP